MVVRPVHVEATEEAARLQEAAAVLRRHAGSLRYHPVTGLAAPPGPEMRDALRRLRESLPRVQGLMGPFAAETAAVERTAGGGVARPLHEGEERLRRITDLLRGALDVLERALAQPERAPLDAPYGLGTPRRPHPGAQATWVAERAETLAREMTNQSVLRANLAPDTTQTTR